MAAKPRLDRWLIEKGYVSDAREASAWILAGRVTLNGQPATSPAVSLEATDTVLVNVSDPYASRGGEKLEGALTEFRISVEGQVALDCGSSTGGFTDCLLRNGAKAVWAVDVGKGLIDASLRKDPRVHLLEETHLLRLSKDQLSPVPTFATLDLSFISLRSVFGQVWNLLDPPRHVLALVKPQFEAAPKDVPGGIVRSPDVIESVLVNVEQAASAAGWSQASRALSRVKGRKGNQEIFLWLRP